MIANTPSATPLAALNENERLAMCASVQRHLSLTLLLQSYARLHNVARAIAFEWSEIERLEGILVGEQPR